MKTPAESSAGLFAISISPAPRAPPIPLKGVRAHVEVSNFTAFVALSQTYVNEEPEPIEAVYVFPLDESAAIVGFEVRIDGRILLGSVKERSQAREVYEEALVQGQAAYLLELQTQSVGDVFRIKVGNLPPGKLVVVSLRYVVELPADLERIRFTLPTTVAPRYGAFVANTTAAAEDKFENPEYSLEASYGLTLDLVARIPGSEVLSVEGISHPITCQLEEGVARVALAAEHTHLDRDFVLLIAPKDPLLPRAVVEHDPAANTRCVALSLVPQFTLSEAKAELILVVDRSGSMEGAKMDQTKKALQLLLRSVPEGCFINIVSFGTDFQPWRPTSQPFSDSTLGELSGYVSELRADMGGTEIMRPFHWIYSQPLVQNAEGRDLPRQIFLLTDGQVDNTVALIDMIRRHSQKARAFALGIGDSVSRHLVNGVARAGRGDAQFVMEGERMEKKVVQQLKRSLQPTISDLVVTWKPAAAAGGKANSKLPFSLGRDSKQPNVVQVPHMLPAIFCGTRFLAYCFYNKGEEVPTEIKISASSPDGPLELVVPVSPPQAAPQGGRGANFTIHKLASLRLIRDLEEGTSYLHSPGVSVDQGAINGMIVALGTRYRLASSKTSYLIVDPETQTEFETLPNVRKVPSYFHNSAPAAQAAAPPSASPAAAATAASSASSPSLTNLPAATPAPKASTSFATTSVPTSRSKMTSLPPSGPVPKGSPAPKGAPAPAPIAVVPASPTKPPPHSAPPHSMEDSPVERKEKRKEKRKQQRTEDLVEGVVMLQRANGSFELGERLAELSGLPLPHLEAQIGDSLAGDHRKAAWATALALGLLRLKAAGHVDEWEMVSNKGLDWLQKILGSQAAVEEVLARAQKVLIVAPVVV